MQDSLIVFAIMQMSLLQAHKCTQAQRWRNIACIMYAFTLV
jgi:hypothetical protein